MKKAIGQTVRDLKRGVNKKVLKVPSIEQKVLDATSNESWGPHGSLLADIAQATRNYHEYQMIMHVIWKRINDTGKNWRHVYKALTVLEYLVAHGSERGIDEIREHVHQISTLSDFQYIDSSGRDQGSNVRRKSQSLVALVNDKERIHEVRQKGTANRDKYQSTYSTGRPGGYGDHHDDDHYASRDEDRYGNGKEREGGYRDDDRYSRGGDSYGREGDRNGGYSDKHYGRDGNRDNDRRGGHGNDDYQYGSRNRSPSRVRSFDGDDCYSSRQLDHQLTEQSVGAPPSYEEAMSDAQNHVQEDRNGDDIIAAAPKSSSPSAHTASSPSESTKQGSSPFAPTDSSPAKSTNQGLGHVPAGVSAPTNDNDNNSFDLFDPRGSVPVVPPAASSLEMDIFESASDPIYSLALTPFTTTTNGTEVDCPANLGVGTDFAMMSSASGIFNQPGENPFGDPPFIATQENFPNQLESFAPATSFDSSISTGVGVLPPAAPKTETVTGFDFDASFGVTYNPVLDGQQYSFASPAILTTQAPVTQPSNDISGMLASHTGFGAFIPMQEAQPAAPTYVQGNVLPQSGPAVLFASQATQLTTEDARPSTPINNQITQSNLLSQPGLQAPRTMEVTAPTPGLPPTNNQITQLNLLSQPGPQAPSTMEVTAQTPALPPIKTAPLKEKFEPKSTVWADTLSRGLVDLNISGPKTNPHADLGIDFDSINRKEKRNEEKKASTAPASTITMGKAMGSGSGLGRTGASALAAPPNPMMGSSMGMGMGMGTMGGAGMGMGMGMGGFGGNMSTMGGAGMGMGMGMGGYGGNMSQPMGTGMNMGMNQGMPAQLPMGVPPGGNGMPGVGYNPMAGMGNYNSQQPYGGGYR